MASLLKLRRVRDAPAFLAAALRLRSLFRRTPGAIRLSLTAIPLHRTFWTLSQWETQEALDAYARHSRHVDTMHRFRDRMAGSTFVTWTTPAAQPPTWPGAHRRVVAAHQAARPSAEPAGAVAAFGHDNASKGCP
jgi:heme-degrading monooxygenase HmoA